MTNYAAVERFFGEYSDLYHAIMDWRLAYSVAKRLLGPLGHRRVLDYGCGDGRFSRLLRDRGAHVTAVDISGEAIAQARRKNSESISYYLIDSGDLSMIPARSMDLAVSTFVLCCVQKRTELSEILRAIHGRLKPGACYVISEPHPDAVGRRFFSMRRTARGPLKSGTPIEVKLVAGSDGALRDYWHPRDEYVELLTDAGFAVEHVIEPTMANYPDEPFWKDEREHPPFLIMRVRK